MKYYSLDIETQGLNAQNFLVGIIVPKDKYNISDAHICNSRKVMFNKIIGLIDYHTQRGERVTFFGHNLSYDFAGIMQEDIIPELSSGRLRVFLPDRLLCQWRGAWFVDSMHFFRGSLSYNASTILGEEKYDTPEKLKLSEKQEYDFIEWNKIITYCHRDCVLLHKLFETIESQLYKLFQYKPRSFTTASKLSLNCFRRYAKQLGLEGYFSRDGVIHKNTYIDEIRCAYRGAYNICFTPGKHDNVTEIDFNSYYPHTMSTMPLPDLTKEVKIIDPLSKSHWNVTKLCGYLGFVHCSIQSPDSFKLPYAFLPIRAYSDGKQKMLYPHHSHLTSIWTLAELELALQLGYRLHDIYSAIVYHPLSCDNPFKPYFDKLYAAKQSSTDPASKYTIKLLMNSLYGKFGQRPERYEHKIIERHELPHYESEGWEWHHTLEEHYVIRSRKPLVYIPNHANYTLGAFTTAYARINHYKEYSKIPPCDLINVNTDNIQFKGDHIGKFTIGNNMGDFHIALQGVSGHWVGENQYYVGEKMVTGGIPASLMTQEIFDTYGSVTLNEMKGISEVYKGNVSDYGTFSTRESQLVEHSKTHWVAPEEIKDEP